MRSNTTNLFSFLKEKFTTTYVRLDMCGIQVWLQVDFVPTTFHFTISNFVSPFCYEESCTVTFYVQNVTICDKVNNTWGCSVSTFSVRIILYISIKLPNQLTLWNIYYTVQSNFRVHYSSFTSSSSCYLIAITDNFCHAIYNEKE